MSTEANPNAGARMVSNRLRTLLEGNEPFWVVNPGGASLDAVDMLARAGACCLFIDCERTAVGIESVTGLTRSAHSHGLAVLLRSESSRPETLVRYLDRGIDGIVVPHTETPAQLQVIGEVISYITRGRREQRVAIAQIESGGALEQVEALARSEHVDGFLIGPNDLAHSLGHAGDTSRPEVMAALDRAAAELQRRGRAWGLPATPAMARQWVGRGAKLLYGTLDQIVKAGFEPMNAALAANQPRGRS